MPPSLRNVYTCEQFAAEILCGQHHPDWVRGQCRRGMKKRGGIRTVGKRPWLIPQSEAIRFISPK